MEEQSFQFREFLLGLADLKTESTACQRNKEQRESTGKTSRSLMRGVKTVGRQEVKFKTEVM